MRTSKPFSTISYNTTDFLKLQLDNLVNTNKIDFYAFVYHYAEEDEEGKNHIHLYIEPGRLTDTNQFLQYFEEIDLKNPSKPLGCITCKSSKFGDWCLYAMHNKAYLASKGQARKYTYSLDSFVSSSKAYLNELYHTIDLSKINRIESIIQQAQDKKPFRDLVSRGIVPLQFIVQARNVYDMYLEPLITSTIRNGRDNHNPTEVEIDDYI